MIIYGGRGIKSLLSDIYSFNLTNFEWKKVEQHGTILGPRESMSSTIVHEGMYIYGGNINEQSTEFDEYSDDFFLITLRNNSVNCQKIMPDSVIPPKRLSHSLSNLNNKHLILFGGEGANKALNDMWTYSIKNNTWHEIKPQNQVTPRMAHVCYCYKDTVIVFGGITQEHVVKSDLAVLKFGKIEINISNGSGINPKRKFTKILNVTTRTAPSILRQESEVMSHSCNKCGHAPSSCIFLERFSEINYPAINYFPRIQTSSHSAEQLASQFSDPFAAMLKIAEVLDTVSIAFNIIGTTSLKGNQIVKLLSSDINKELMSYMNINDSIGKGINLINVPILEISTKSELSPEQIMNLCSGVSRKSFLPAFLRLSDTCVIISRTRNHLTVALMHKTEMYVPLFYAVFDTSGEPLYPCKELAHSIMVNVYSRSHLQSGDVFKHQQGTSIYLYPKELESIVGDILYQGNSFSRLVEKLKGLQYIVAGSLIKNDKSYKEQVINKPIPLLFTSCTNLFSVLIYVKKKLVYWEFQKNEKGKRAREECLILKLINEDLINPITGMLLWNTKTMHIFGDIYSLPKKICMEE